MEKEKYSVENLMRRFVKNEIGNKISKKTPRADMIKCLLVQELGLKEENILIRPEYLENIPKVIYGHLTTEFSIILEDSELDIVVAEDNSGFIMLKTKLAFNELNKKSPYLKNPIYKPVPSKGYFDPLIKFFNDITGRKKLIDFKFIPEEYQKYYIRNDRFAFSERHLWEGDTETAEQIVRDLYRQRFNSNVSGPFFEAKYNDGYDSAKLKFLTLNFMHKNVQSAEK